jgi:AraC-like DNA-binding protein
MGNTCIGGGGKDATIMTNELRLFDHYNHAAPVINKVYRVRHRPGLDYAGFSNDKHYGLLFTLNGQGRMNFNCDEGVATSGMIFHGGGGFWHEYGALGDDDWEIVIIAYDTPGALIDREVVCCHFESYQSPAVRRLLIQLHQLGEPKGVGDRLRENGLFYRLLSEIFSNTTLDGKDLDARTLYDEVAAWIRANCTQDLDIPSVARHFHVTANRLYYVFRKFSGKGPAGHINDCRLHHACDLLRADRMSVGDVASQIGYADGFSFSKQFKKKYGVAPSHFQRSAK